MAGSYVIRKVFRLKILNTRAFSDIQPDEKSKKTHTGQEFENDDIRNLRYKNYKREVNPNISLDIIKGTPPIKINSRVYGCCGNGARGHPKIYINLDKPGAHTCGYCGEKYIKEH